ncbi:hypothetical protein HUJ04_011573 [Dendroctonus ponderosae]|nr:hypothetical protein HUJ04_011573 [Dendroctonus ponderosae]KAH1028719.1 hypothetical protein HUJ05_002049 [Dendroctonus ponderosae]
MLVKKPKPQVRKWIRRTAAIAFVAEAVAFAFTYYGWTKVNQDRETRKYLRDSYPSVLEAYYKTALMEPNRLIKSIFWLTSLTGAGYLLLIATTASQDSSKLKDYPGIERDQKVVLSQKQRLLNVLQAATEADKPLYRMTKEEIQKTLNKK